jgi:5-methylcytosine-specific restriction endonuclease McrA
MPSRKGRNEASRERRTRIAAGSDGTVTRAVLRALYAARCCAYCRRTIPRRERTIDHKVPLARGGRHTARNLVMACRACNSSKGDRTAAEFGHPGIVARVATWLWLLAIAALFATAVTRA